ncbi:hypothetical protein BD324DRAFT_576791 [Kockovaella imperatae]|uniref:Major facilitator superfamily domain-containing protein n=1 Tax=Kockovaella imperatae TaxID=4999 RepID=A0A1Y1UMU1_9TREE|nr:hypothetical protein BD324DRAFT_576791 [Kockovaella imperatae]ORX39370.1 hypothetical protein BD324DRAFT_576791 [Kockovaella imperatae]
MATATPPGKITLPPAPSPREIFDDPSYESPRSELNSTRKSQRGVQLDLNDDPSVPLPKQRRRSTRPSFATSIRRPGTMGIRARQASRASAWSGVAETVMDESLKLPSLVPGIRPAYSTPLPVLPMVVLCIAMLSELLSANLCTPFLLKMVEGFFLSSGREKNSETEAAVGLWTGNLVSVFFITQFFTSLLWSKIADRHGRRAVLVASLSGSAIALMIFGTSESLPEAICVRLVQGIFGGAVGVFRGSIRDITDETNASQAYSILGFMWGFGAVMGPIFGGVFENPATNFSNSFLGHIELFHTFPYLLPTLFASTILITGSILACFLSWDGGVRGGSRIALSIEKNEPLVPAQVPDESPAPSSRTAVPSLRNKRSVLTPDPELLSPTDPTGPVPNRRDSRASLGTAYGYGGIRSKHPTLAARAALEAARRVSQATVRQEPSDEMEEEPRLGLAQKWLLANEENTFNINDLWVSAAVAQETAVFEDEDEDEDADASASANSPVFTPGSESAASGSVSRRGNRVLSARFGPAAHRFSTSRKFSTSSGQLPAIFANTGLSELPALESPRESGQDPFFPSPAPGRVVPSGLGAIAEGRQVNETSPLVSPNVELVEQPTSTWKSLPLLMILEYGLLAFHNTTHDQIYLSFLVTPYRSGGLGLNPANFSLIIATMCIFQLFYQFYLYPRLGPPLGQFTHIQMFRIGCFLYLPAYLCLPFLHKIVGENSSGGMFTVGCEAIRYCAGTLAYTSVMVLINAMSPPHVVGLANGLAQSTVSFARFFGPVVGGSASLSKMGLWSASISGNPTGYSRPFFTVALFCLIQWSVSFFIR